MLKVTQVKKNFNGNQVLKGIDLNIEKGDVIAIIGPSGSGKTTLLRCINFLEKADSGIMEFDGQTFDLAKITKKEILQLRKKTAFVFQNFNLFRNKTVLKNVTEGLITVRKMKKAEAEKVAMEFLTKVGMDDKVNSYPYEISGGQQQRVAIARALATNPQIIYFDEPTSALDPELIGEVLSVIKQLADEERTMLIVTHELNFARSVSNKVVFMENGEIIESSSTSDFFQNPQTQRSRDFLKSLNSGH